MSRPPTSALELQATGHDNTVDILDDATPAPGATRADFKIGDNVAFLDRDNRPHFGRAVRLNQKTAFLECDNGTWRVSYGLLQHVVDV